MPRIPRQLRQTIPPPRSHGSPFGRRRSPHRRRPNNVHPPHTHLVLHLRHRARSDHPRQAVQVPRRAGTAVGQPPRQRSPRIHDRRRPAQDHADSRSRNRTRRFRDQTRAARAGAGSGRPRKQRLPDWSSGSRITNYHQPRSSRFSTRRFPAPLRACGWVSLLTSPRSSSDDAAASMSRRRAARRIQHPPRHAPPPGLPRRRVKHAHGLHGDAIGRAPSPYPSAPPGARYSPLRSSEHGYTAPRSFVSPGPQKRHFSRCCPASVSSRTKHLRVPAPSLGARTA